MNNKGFVPASTILIVGIVFFQFYLEKAMKNWFTSGASPLLSFYAFQLTMNHRV